MDLLDKFKFCRVMFPCLSHTAPCLFSVCSSNTVLELLLVVLCGIYNDIHAKIHENIDQIVACHDLLVYGVSTTFRGYQQDHLT